MKACKKCKKHVANKAKACKYCGNDVSKAKIIKQIEPENQIKKTDIDLNFEDKTNDRPITINEEKYIFIEEVNTDLIMKRRKKVNKKQRIMKAIIILLIIMSVISVGTYFVIKVLKIDDDVIVVDDLKKNQKNVYKMGDKISYKGVIYRVTKIETSEGNNYFKPKQDNQYLVVYLEIINRSNNLAKYSYENWKMNNSNDEEASRIFVAINVSTALYSGELPISARKTGSIVFEEPIADDNLVLRFYNIVDEKEEQKEAEIKKEKPVFEIKIKVPKAKKE